MEMVTVILTACGRHDLLKRTVESFCKNNTYPISKIVIRDDSGIKPSVELLMNMEFNIDKSIKIYILNDARKIGQLKSIDMLMEHVDTEYVMHLEDDWEFYHKGFVEKAIDILNEHRDIVQVWFRPKKDGFRHNLLPLRHFTKNKTPFKLIEKTNHMTGFTWNPHLRRLDDYKIPFSEIGKEYLIGKYYQNYRTAILEEGYCRHIGGGRTCSTNHNMRG